MRREHEKLSAYFSVHTGDEMKPRSKGDYGDAIRKILPGDHIHFVAPSSKDAPTSARLAAIDAANRKRARKLAKARPGVKCAYCAGSGFGGNDSDNGGCLHCGGFGWVNP